MFSSSPVSERRWELRFVLAKVNVDIDDGHAIAHAYGIERLPTDVIITPTNRVLAKLACPDNPTQYLAQLDQAAAAASQLGAGPPNMVAQSGWEFGAADRKSVSEPSGRRTECDGSAPGAVPPRFSTAAGLWTDGCGACQ